MMKFIIRLVLLSFLTSCQAGLPEIETLMSLGNFSVNQDSFTVRSKSLNQSLTISGNCDMTINDIEVSFDSGATFEKAWQSGAAINNNCANDGTFSIMVGAGNPQYSIPAADNYKVILVRGLGTFGYTSAATVRIELYYDRGGITAGSAIATSTISGITYTLKGGVTNSSNVSTSAGGYTLKGSLKIK